MGVRKRCGGWISRRRSLGFSVHRVNITREVFGLRGWVSRRRFFGPRGRRRSQGNATDGSHEGGLWSWAPDEYHEGGLWSSGLPAFSKKCGGGIPGGVAGRCCSGCAGCILSYWFRGSRAQEGGRAQEEGVRTSSVSQGHARVGGVRKPRALVVPGAYYRTGCAGHVLKKEAACKKKEYVQVPSHRFMPGRVA